MGVDDTTYTDSPMKWMLYYHLVVIKVYMCVGRWYDVVMAIVDTVRWFWVFLLVLRIGVIKAINKMGIMYFTLGTG